MRRYTLHAGDCRDVMRDYPADHFDSIVSDPPYGLSFMGKGWDRGVPGEEFWREALRVAKPGAHLLAFGGSRTFHRLTVAIEDAGWEIRDVVCWLYSTGFPKSLNFGCKCGRGALPYDHANQPTTKHNLSRLRVADVPPTSTTATGQGQVLLSRVSQHGASKLRQARPESEVAGSIEPGMEGGRDVLAQEGQLQADQVRPMHSRVPADGAEGWLHHGTSLDHGSVDRAVPDADGGRASSQPRPARQPAVQLGTVPEQRRTQTRGMASPEVCQVCGGLTDWSGWGTALKPAWEPVIVARKPLVGTVAANVTRYGTGAINIDGCRVGADQTVTRRQPTQTGPSGWKTTGFATVTHKLNPPGRWPANVMHDGSDEVVAGFPTTGPAQASMRGDRTGVVMDADWGGPNTLRGHNDAGGSAARYYYCAKASRADREEGCDHLPTRSGAEAVDRDDDTAGLQSPRAGAGRTADTVRNFHPTVKPTDLMRYLARLVTPPDGLLLDPFMGSGSTGKGALLEGFRFVGIDLDPAHVAIAEARCQFAVDYVDAEAAAAEAPGAQLALF